MRMEERLADLITDNILPRLVPELEMLSWHRTHVLAVHVYPCAGRPLSKQMLIRSQKVTSDSMVREVIDSRKNDLLDGNLKICRQCTTPYRNGLCPQIRTRMVRQGNF